MLTKEDLKLISDLLDEKLDEKLGEKLNPIHKDIETMKEDIEIMKEDIDVLKEDMKEVKGMVNILSQWAEAATEYHIHEIHYPLKDDEIVR